MKTFFRLLVGLLLLAGWAVAALSLHVVRSVDPHSGRERWVVVPKSRLGVSETYVDVRNWTASEVAEHPGFVRRLIASGKADALAHLAGGEDSTDFPKLLESWIDNPPATQPH